MNENQDVELAGGGKIESLGDCLLSNLEAYDSLKGNIQDGISKMLQVDSTIGISSENEEEDMQETVDNAEEEEDKGVEIQEHEFSVGEFVWARTLNQPWWPGQVYDPVDASKDIAMYNRKGRVLVAFFGKETSAWCYPSQVKPFLDLYHQMSMQGNPSSLCGAVMEVLSRIGGYIERQMMCSCVTLETLKKLARPLALNSGLRKGVIEREAKIVGLSASEFNPAKFLEHLHCSGKFVYEISPFERIVFQSQLMAFKRANGWCQSHIYLEVQGASDCMGDDGWAIRPSEADLPLLTVWNNLGRNASAKNIRKKKRQRMNDPLALTSKKRKKNIDFESGEYGDLAEYGSSNRRFDSGSKQKEKAKSCVSDSAFQDGTLQNDNNGVLEGCTTVFLCRERKKSKYLSPPYTMLSRVYKSLLSLKDNVPNSVDDSKKSQPKKSISRAQGETRKQQSSPKKKEVEINMEACNILSELYTAAIHPIYLKESNKADQIKSFFLYMRSYRRVSDCQRTDEGGVPQCINGNTALPKEDVHKTDHPSSLVLVKCKKKKRDLKEDARARVAENEIANSLLVSTVQDTHETYCQTTEGSSQMNEGIWTEAAIFQMSQSDLLDMKVCSPGEYVQKPDCSTSDGGKRKRGRKKKISASEGLHIGVETTASIRNKKTQNFRNSDNNGNSQHITTSLRGNGTISPSTVLLTARVPPLQVVKRNLENMRSMLEKAGDRLSPGVRANLENEIKRLLQKVEMVA